MANEWAFSEHDLEAMLAATTPGPWNLQEDVRHYPTDGLLVGIDVSGPPAGETLTAICFDLANAQLIAAAPSLARQLADLIVASRNVLPLINAYPERSPGAVAYLVLRNLLPRSKV
jgi:hypothetical protein